MKVANMAKICGSVGWAEAIIAPLGTYQEVVAALIAELPGRLAERANCKVVAAIGGGKAVGQERPGDLELGPSGKHQRRGGGQQVAGLEAGPVRGEGNADRALLLASGKPM